jgi:hypothetical protein
MWSYSFYFCKVFNLNSHFPPSHVAHLEELVNFKRCLILCHTWVLWHKVWILLSWLCVHISCITHHSSFSKWGSIIGTISNHIPTKNGHKWKKIKNKAWVQMPLILLQMVSYKHCFTWKSMCCLIATEGVTLPKFTKKYGFCFVGMNPKHIKYLKIDKCFGHGATHP